MFCTRCGHENPDDARFCAQCGAPLSRAEYAASPDATSIFQPGALRRGPGCRRGAGRRARGRGRRAAGRLGAAGGQARPNAGSRFLLDQDVTTAGRHPDSDIFLDDVTVSRRHAEFHREGGGFIVHDVGSLNGTYVNRRAGRRRHPGRRRRGADRQVPAASTWPVPARAVTSRPPYGERARARAGSDEAGRPAARAGRERDERGRGARRVAEHRRGAGQLRAEFPDITISKIRFLEAEGLVHPERTPSGYRKFTRADVAGCASCWPRSATTTCRCG